MMRKWISIAGATLLLLSCSKALNLSTRSTEAGRLFEQAEAKADNLLIAEALPDLERAVKLDGDFALAWAKLAGVYQSFGEEEKAKQAMKRAQELAPRASEYEKLRISAHVAAIEEDYQRLFQIARQTVERYPHYKRPRWVLASQLYFRGRYKEAIAELRKALQIDPEYAPACNMLGYSHAALRQFDEALDALHRYVSLLPNHPNPHDSYGEVLLAVGRYDEAIKEFTKANSLKAGIHFVLQHLGQAYAAQGRYKEAGTFYEQALEVAGSDDAKASVHLDLGVTALKREDYDEAMAQAQLSMKLDPGRP